MDEKDETPAGQPASNSVAAAEAESSPQNQAARTYTAAALEKAVAEALTQAGNDARSARALKAALTAEKEAFDKQRAEWEGKLAEAKAAIYASNVLAIARKHQVDGEALKKQADALGISELTKIEGLAGLMAKNTEIHFDSGRTSGGGAGGNLKPEEKYALGLKAEGRK